MAPPRAPLTWGRRRRRRPSLAALPAFVLQTLACSLLLVSSTASVRYRSPTLDLDFSPSDSAVCGAWPADYAALHARIRQTSAAAHAAQLAEHRTPAGLLAWLVSTASSAPARAYDPSVRFLTFEWLDGCGGFGDVLNGMLLAFVTAVLDGRAFILRHDCLPAAFSPAMIDWAPSADVPLVPAREIPPPENKWDGVLPNARPRGGKVQPGEVVRVDLRNTRVDLEGYFREFENATNIRVSANLGMLTYMATRAQGEWAERFKAIGMRLPYVVGCLLRFLLRPRPEVRELFRSTERRLRSRTANTGNSNDSIQSSSSSSASSRSSSGRREQEVATVGIHIRVEDEVVWAGDRGAPKQLNASQVEQLLTYASTWLNCAQSVEEYWFPPSLTVRWMVITNSVQLKAAIKSKYPDKVITTEFIPRHSNVLASGDQGSIIKLTALSGLFSSNSNSGDSTTEGAAIESSKQREARMFRELVTEWLLLASCDAYVISRSGYSHTSVFYSRRTMAIFEYDRCDPEQPTQTTYMGEDWSGI